MTDLFQTVLLLLLALACLYGILMAAWPKAFERLARRVFRTRPTDEERHRWLVVVGVPVAALWLVLLLHVLVTTFGLWWSPPEVAAEGGPLAHRLHFLAIFGMLTALAGLVGFPLALVRLRATERQTITAEQGHITDRINKAVENLGADKEVNRLGRTVRSTREGEDSSYFEWQDDQRDPPDHDTADGKRKLTNDPWQMHTQTQPNLEVRLGALYALERIAQDSDRDHIQIMEILCAYIRQNAPAPEKEDNPHHVFRHLVEGADGKPWLPENEAFAHRDFVQRNTYASTPADMTVWNMVQKWAIIYLTHQRAKATYNTTS